MALPTDFSARIARNTQLFLQQESGTTRIIDPWGGSYYVERLTHDLADKAWGHIQEVEELGGMAKAIEAGIPKLRIEEAAAKTQARIDAGRQSVIGVNKYKPDGRRGRSTCSRSTIPPCGGCSSTSSRLLKRERDPKAVEAALAASPARAERGNGNLLALAIDAARAKATVGEISDGAGKGVRASSRRDQGDLGRLQAGGRTAMSDAVETRAEAGRPQFEETKAAARASSSPRSARTATTAARK